MMRGECGQDLGLLDDVINAQPCHRDEPNGHDRAEELADVSSSAPLDREKCDENATRQREYERRQVVDWRF